MAILQKGVLGGFSGLIGNVVGANWRSLDVIRSRPKKSKKAPVQSQIDQRLKFGLVTAFFGRLTSFINLGYQSANKVQTPMNAAIAYHLQHAITGTSPDFSLDYTKVVMSIGQMADAANAGVAVTTGQLLEFSWEALEEPDIVEKALRDTDNLRVIIYSPVKGISMTATLAERRSAGSGSLKVPKTFTGSPIHVWLFLASADGKEVSRSQYLGEATLVV